MHIKRRQPVLNDELGDGIPLFLRRIYASRGVSHYSQLENELQHLESFESMLDIEKAAKRLFLAIKNNQHIIIIGDFDADGATSTALAVSALKAMGAKEVSFMVPNRFEYGYGLTPPIVEIAAQKKADLIITVDNGISSLDGVACANKLKIDVIVTDHHLPGEVLPDAFAIVNPNREGDPFVSKSIAGVGVIFYVMLALRKQLQQEGWFDSKQLKVPNMGNYLDLVALGTVADVVALDKNNRILVAHGIKRLRHQGGRPGIRALIEISGRQYERLLESDLGFAVAPRLNAAGRLEDMSLGIECLLETDYDAALEKVSYLNQLNDERKKIETEMKRQATDDLKALSLRSTNQHSLAVGLCLFDEHWHQGVIGILAGRIKEQYHRPTIIFAKVSENELKGSARSVLRVNIRDILAAIDKDNPGLIHKFGGHAMAAGLSIAPSQFEQFKTAFEIEVGKHLKTEDCSGICLTDGSLPFKAISLETALLIQNAGPWGQGFPEPVFDDVFEILDQKMVGKCHLKLTLGEGSGDFLFEAIAFNVDTQQWPNFRLRKIHIAYKLDINFFAGRQKLQLLIQSIVPIEESAVVQESKVY